MSILLVISVLAFSALLWAVLSIARHIRVITRNGHSSSDSLLLPSPPPGRRVHQPFADLNETIIARRVPQQPARASARQDHHTAA